MIGSLRAILLLVLVISWNATAFGPLSTLSRINTTRQRRYAAARAPLHSTAEAQQSEIETYLAENYPSFYNLLLFNAVDVQKALRQPEQVFTIFAPNDRAFEMLGDKKIQQLRDPRNLETTNKIAAYHVVVDDSQVVTAEMILDPNSKIGGIMTMGGQVPIMPSQSGGFMGLGAKADGGVIVGPGAKIVYSVNGPGGVVHEVDGLISNKLIWRYMDQLRLPGL